MHAHTSTTVRLLTAGAATLAVGLAGPTATAASASAEDRSGTNELVGLSDDGRLVDGKSRINGTANVASRNGRFVVFSTPARLVPADRNRLDDVYVRDTVADRTRLVSVTRTGRIGNDYSVEPSISYDGRYVAFTTWADNLFRDRNGHTLDVVVKDLETGRIELVSRSTSGRQATRNSFFPVISGNGRRVAFQSFGRFSRTDEDRREDVYVYDRVADRTRHVSRKADGSDVRAGVLVGGISADGRKVTFGTDNDGWVRDLRAGVTKRFWHEANHPDQPFPMGSLGRPQISGDGRYVAFSTLREATGDADNHAADVFRMHLGSRAVAKVTVAQDGGPGGDHSFLPSLSYDGSLVGFMSFAQDLVAGDVPGADTFVRDMTTGSTVMASWGAEGPGDNDSGRNGVAISGDGRTLVYETYAENLVAGDTNHALKVLAWRR